MTTKNIRLCYIILFYCTINLFSFGQNKIDSLITIIKSGKYDTNMVYAFAHLCNEYKYNDTKIAILYAQKGLILSEKIGFIKGIAICYNNIGSVYYNLDSYQKAFESYQKALKIYEFLRLTKGISSCYINIGMIHSTQRNYSQALKYYLKSLEICEKLDDKNCMACCYNNIGNIYESQGSLSNALEYFRKSLKMSELTNNKFGESTNYNNIGIILSEQANYTEALEYYKKSLKINKELNNEMRISGCYANISDLCLILKNYPQALEYGYKALALAKKLGALDLKQTAYFNLSTIHDSLGNIKEALKYYMLYSKTNDSIINKESQKKIAEMEVKYETEKKEKEIGNQKTKITLLEQGKKIERYRRNGLIALVFIISLLSILIFFNFKKRMKLNNQLFENQKLLAEAELKNEKLNSIQLHKELEYKNNELMTFALFITQKNEILENIKNQINEVSKKLNNNDNVQLINQVSSEVSYYISLEKDKEEFQAHINNIYRSFFMKLDEKFPDLSENERRISSLLRINLSSKDIGVLMNISTKSVEMNRYRLRKKLNLQPEENLSEFLNKIG
ncbi:MAG: tetratricopeptide repeat protein [Bacteroidetes bacterium]|nr:tetratricopeptide repeat protein [Bacteroidota bacterium]